MPVLDFKEIPEANAADGKQDSFELFARDFLQSLGYKILEGPDRGIDGGRDIIVLEVRKGVGGESHIRWLVSCKHKAFSGKAVSVDDELNILERVEQKKCQGFLGVYSTVPSAQLTARLEGLRAKTEYLVLDQERIEGSLLSSVSGLKLAQRYFPKSFDKWKVENPRPAKVFSDQATLECEYCGKDLLNPKDGIIVMWHTMPDEYTYTKRITDTYWCCKGDCDRALQSSHRHVNVIDGWEDIPDVCIPLVYIKWVMTILNEHHRGDVYSEPAFDKMKQFLLTLYPYVARESTGAEKDRLKNLFQIPSYLGGLGFD
jgi:hypothetical protein